MSEFKGTERFEIVRRIGDGGMGVVYEALDRERRMRVALKTLLEMDDGGLYLFKQEFRSLTNVVHPNLVTLYELFAAEGSWFFTMELIHGTPFLDFIRRGRVAAEPAAAGGLASTPDDSLFRSFLDTVPMDASTRPELAGGDAGGSAPPLATPAQFGRLREVFRQLVTGVDALHEAGKLHCDIKPTNALVAEGDRVVLLDFGLVAHRSHRPIEHRASREGWGTIPYMAPEQVQGATLTPATDWYAVGATLYEALTARRPFTGTVTEVIYCKQNVDPPSPRSLAPEVPEDLDRLCARMLCRDPADRPVSGEILRALGDEGRAVELGVIARDAEPGEALLVGRESQLGALEEAYEAVREGRTTLVFVHGRSGVGKSTLLDRFLDDLAAREDVVVLAGRCYPDESVPYKAFDSLVDDLSQYLRRVSEDELRALVPPGIHALAQIFPVLLGFASLAPAPSPGSGLTPLQTRRLAFAALRDLLTRIGRGRPLVLLVDDLQWGDEDSVGLLAEILRSPFAPRLLFLAAYRSEFADASPFLASLREALSFEAGPPGWRDLPVEPLTPEAATALAEKLLAANGPADAEHVGRIVRESEGNPYFVHELARASAGGSGLFARVGEGTRLTLDEILWARVQKLPEPERRLLEVVVVSGRPLRLVHAYGAAFVEGEGHPVMPALRVGNLVRSSGSGEHVSVDTYHDRVRETILARLPQDARRAHHGSLARTLESSGLDDPETLGVHFHGAGELERAGGYYAKAGESAAGVLAFEQASRLLRLSLELRRAEPSEERRLRLQLGDALGNAGRGPEAAREYELASAGAPPEETLDLRRRAAFQYCISGHLDEGRAAFGQVLAGVGMRLPPTTTRALLSVLLSRARLQLRGLAFREREPGAIPRATLARIDITRSVAVGLSIMDPITGADFQTRSLLLALEAGEPFRLALALAWEAAHSSLSGGASAKRTARLLAEAGRLAERHREPHALGLVALARGVCDFFEGRFRECGVRSDEALTVLRAVAGVTWEQHTAEIYGFWGRLLSGDLVELQRRLDRLSAEADERADLYTLLNLTTQGGAMVRLAAGDPEAARAAIHGVMERWTRKSFTIQHLGGQFGEFYCDLYAGETERGWRRVGEVWPKVTRAMQNQVQYIRVYLGQLSALAALARAGDSRESAPFVRDAARRARSLRGEKIAWATSLAAMIEAGVASHRGDRERERALLEESVRGFDATGLILHAAAARERLGALIGGDEGRELRAVSAACMAEQGIRDPARMARVFAPESRA